MYESDHSLSEKLRWMLFCIMILLPSVLALVLLRPQPQTNVQTTAATTDSPTIYVAGGSGDSPNVITNGMATALELIGQSAGEIANRAQSATSNMSQSLSKSGDTIAGAVSQTGKLTIRSARFAATSTVGSIRNTGAFIGHALTAGTMAAVRCVGNGFAFVLRVPGTILGFAGDTPVVSALIRPAAAMPAPIIDTHQSPRPATIAAQAALAPATAVTAAHAAPPASSPPSDTTASWPIHGTVTTEFGVPHWPYQPTHSGIDISDGQRSGITPVHPYKPGRVIEAVQSYGGLGNHVVIDHGGGVTSAYGHMSSIAVTVGQGVDKSTTLGLEGSTGASTGPHVHFEIRVNGQAVNPRLYVVGQP